MQSSEGAIRVRHTGGGGGRGRALPRSVLQRLDSDTASQPQSSISLQRSHCSHCRAQSGSPLLARFLSLRRCALLRTRSAASLVKTGACPSALACPAGKGAAPDGLRKGPVTVRTQGTVPALPRPSWRVRALWQPLVLMRKCEERGGDAGAEEGHWHLTQVVGLLEAKGPSPSGLRAEPALLVSQREVAIAGHGDAGFARHSVPTADGADLFTV